MSEMWAGAHAPQAGRSSTGMVVRAMALVLLLVAGLRPASAQTAQPATPPSSAQLSAAQAQQALAVLRDDKRRAELINTLDAIARAGGTSAVVPAGAPATPAASPATAPATTPASTPGTAASSAAASSVTAPAEPPAAPAAKPDAAPAKPSTIAPDSVGVQLAGRLSIMMSAYAQELGASIRSVNDLPLLWRWLVSQARDPAARTAILDAVLKLVLVIAGGLAGEWLVGRILRRLRRTIDAWTPKHTDAEAPENAVQETEARRRRYQRVLRGLRQLPYLFGRLLLDLLPLAVFIAVAELILGTAVGDSREARLIVLEAVQAYVIARATMAVANLLFSPKPPRLLAVTDWAAAFLIRWTRRVVTITATSIALAHIGLLLGMYHTAETVMLKMLMLVVHICLVVAVLQARAPVAHRLRARRTVKGLWATLLNRFADIWHLVAIFYILGLWAVWAVEIQNGYERLLSICGFTLVVGLCARVVAVLALGGLDRVRHVLAAQSHQSVVDRADIYYPAVRGVVTTAIWLVAVTALLEAWGLPVLFWFTAGGLGGRVLDAGSTVVVAVVVAVVVWELANAALGRHLSQLSSSAQFARAGRLRTLLPLLRTTLMVTIVLVVGMIALSAIGVNIAPLLAGAGVIGIAVGFGSQKLVQDLITGLFLLLENAMQVGDVVTLGGMSGTVEALSIRTIRLRALDGSVHVIPFSSVTTVTNQTRDYGYAVLDVAIGLNEEPGRIEDVLRDVASEMQSDPDWQSVVVDKLDVMGVEKLTDVAWIMRVRMKTQPASRWRVSRELNRRIKMRFDEDAIESPFTSHRVLSAPTIPPSLSVKEEPA